MVHLTINLTRVVGRDPPYDHNFLLGSAVYRMLKERSEKAADIVHDSPSRSAYVLSEIHRVRGKPKEAWFRIGSSSEAIIRLVEKALTPGTSLIVGPTAFQIGSTGIEEPVARPGEYVTLSPILLRDKETGQSIVHDTPGYVETLQEAANQQVRNHLKREGTIRILHFEPQAVRRRTIEDRTVLAQKGRFLMDGGEEELRLLVNHGIGLSPALGFGMVVLNSHKAPHLLNLDIPPAQERGGAG